MRPDAGDGRAIANLVDGALRPRYPKTSYSTKWLNTRFFRNRAPDRLDAIFSALADPTRRVDARFA